MAPERRAIIAPRSGHHDVLLPIKYEDPPNPWSDPLSHQYLQAPLPDQVVIGLLELEEDLVYDLLLRCHQLLDHLGF